MHDDHLKEYMERMGPLARRDSDVPAGTAMALPELGEAYQAYARAVTEPVYTLHCLLGAAGCRSFQYVHLDSDSHFTVDRKGQVIGLRFCSLKTIAVTIRGRNLRKLYDLIHQHRMPWVMQLEAGRDFSAGDEPVITSIDIAEVGDEDEKLSERGSAQVLEIG